MKTSTDMNARIAKKIVRRHNHNYRICDTITFGKYSSLFFKAMTICLRKVRTNKWEYCVIRYALCCNYIYLPNPNTKRSDLFPPKRTNNIKDYDVLDLVIPEFKYLEKREEKLKVIKGKTI